ncbi:hypothetical protein SDJN03_00711, partial [Cucurbita argyrosperma subsp. sororia]
MKWQCDPRIGDPDGGWRSSIQWAYGIHKFGWKKRNATQRAMEKKKWNVKPHRVDLLKKSRFVGSRTSFYGGKQKASLFRCALRLAWLGLPLPALAPLL